MSNVTFTQSNFLRTARCAFIAIVCGMLPACDIELPKEAGFPEKPRGFEPASAVARGPDRVARCNTVHSLTLPASIRQRYGVQPDEGTALISCSLQLESGAPPNIASRVSGTQTLLTGRTTPLEFEQAANEGVTVHMAPFSLEGKSAIDFEVQLTDEQTGRTYTVELRQSELPGRR
jgi:hypothetical protein